jgi:uncharacterized membrane protein (UPF0127 family)
VPGTSRSRRFHPATRRGVALALALAVGLAGCSGPDGPDPTTQAGPTDAPPTTLEPATPPAPGPPPLHPDVDRMPAATVVLDGRDRIEIPVRVAATPDDRRRGLMHVPDLPEGTGMVFRFDELRDGGFWMKDTLVPLDIAFADEDGTIVDVLAMDPCEDDPCPVYRPSSSYVTALEVPQGWFASVGIEVGDRLVVVDHVEEERTS